MSGTNSNLMHTRGEQTFQMLHAAPPAVCELGVTAACWTAEGSSGPAQCCCTQTLAEVSALTAEASNYGPAAPGLRVPSQRLGAACRAEAVGTTSRHRLFA